MDAVIKFNSEQWTIILNKLTMRMRDVKPYLKTAYATIGFKDIIAHFREETGPEGKWKPRSPETQRHYALMGKHNSMYNPSNKLLQLSGNLRDSILPANTKDNGVNSIVVFANSPVGGYHNDPQSPRMPKREFMWLSDSAKHNMAKMIANLIVESL